MMFLRSKGCARAPYIFLMLLFLNATLSLALESDSSQPIQIESDTLHYDNLQKTSVYSGNVHFRQGSIHLAAEKAELVNDDKAIQHLRAEGNPATYSQQLDEKTTLTASALKIVYDATKQRIELTEDARIQQNEDTFTAHKITYDLASKQLSSSGGRTHITIQPRKRSNHD